VCGLSIVDVNEPKCLMMRGGFVGQTGDCRLSEKALYHVGN